MDALLKITHIDNKNMSVISLSGLDNFIFDARDYCIHIHRTIYPQIYKNHLSLDWRILPDFNESCYSFPYRLSTIIEILFWYKTSRYLEKHSEWINKKAIIIVPRSSLHEKEISIWDWVEICFFLRRRYFINKIFIVFDTEKWNEKNFKFKWLKVKSNP